MTKIKYFSIILLLSYLLQSCMAVFPLVKIKKDEKTAITHNDVMTKYITKKDVITGFGVPTAKEQFEGIEIWFYDKGSTSRTSSYGNANTYGYSGINASASSSTKTYNKYVEFQFENDRVVNWRTEGIDYGDKTDWRLPYAIGLLIDTILTITLALTFY